MSENRIFFRETVEQILSDTLDPQAIEATEQRKLPTSFYRALVENGVTTMLAPEDKGGIGADIGDAFAILRAMGAAAAPGPILETLLGNRLLAEAGLETAEGLIALAFADEDATILHDVPWGGMVDHLLVVTSKGIALSRPDDWSVTPAFDEAGEPRDTLNGKLGPIVPFDTATVLRLAAVLRSAQILGAIDWTLTRTIEYASEREQFGRPIAKFQVVQQMLAELASHMLASAGLAEGAAEAGSETLVAAARSRLADASDAAIAIGHQVHGAIGYSKEYALNLRTRRLMAWRDDYGSVSFWRRRLGGAFVACDRKTFWPAVADAGNQHAA